jgi:hypothetical protein
MNTNKMLKISIGILLIALISTSYAVYHLWTTKEIGMSAKISTVLNLGIYEDEQCTIPLTTYNWGDYGAGDKTKAIYIKNLGNDKGYFVWNTTGSGWTLMSNIYHNANCYYYTDGNFNFTVGSATYPDPNNVIYPEGATEDHYYLLNPGEVRLLYMHCWTQAYFACESSWTLYFKFYDNLP